MRQVPALASRQVNMGCEPVGSVSTGHVVGERARNNLHGCTACLPVQDSAKLGQALSLVEDGQLRVGQVCNADVPASVHVRRHAEVW